MNYACPFDVNGINHGDKIDSHSVRKVSIWSSILKEVQVL
ncbi:hypothetical protein Tco_0701798, partial [Tanacetum coccineum]